jgi:hypothetical protein
MTWFTAVLLYLLACLVSMVVTLLVMPGGKDD